MKKYDIWSEGYHITGMEGFPAKAWCVATEVEGEDFLDTVTNWCNKDPEKIECEYGGFSIRGGVPCLWGCRLFDNEADARESFG